MDAKIEEIKQKVILKNEGVDYTSTYEYPNTTDNPANTSIEAFTENLDVKIISKSEEDIKFDIKGIDAAMANALRRIFIAEIPTVAIEKVNMWQNTSVIPDEVLAHRMGLVPIKVDPRLFEYKDKNQEYDETNCVKFKLHVRCTRKDGVQHDPKAEILPNNEELLFNHSSVYASDMEWIPLGDQAEKFKNTPIRPVYEDILIAKLGPGQEIEMELMCEKGIGKTHAKWSPVATAYYRLMPEVTFNEDITGDEAIELSQKWPKLFDIDESGKLYVKNQRACDTSREIIRDERFTNKIKLAKIKNHFEFTIESVGMYKPEEIFIEGISTILKNKVKYWRKQLKQIDG